MILILPRPCHCNCINSIHNKSKARIVDTADTADVPTEMVNIDDLMAILAQLDFGLRLSESAMQAVRQSILAGGEQWVVPGDVFVRYIELVEPLVSIIKEAHASAEDVAPGWSDWVRTNHYVYIPPASVAFSQFCEFLVGKA